MCLRSGHNLAYPRAGDRRLRGRGLRPRGQPPLPQALPAAAQHPGAAEPGWVCRHSSLRWPLQYRELWHQLLCAGTAGSLVLDGDLARRVWPQRIGSAAALRRRSSGVLRRTVLARRTDATEKRGGSKKPGTKPAKKKGCGQAAEEAASVAAGEPQEAWPTEISEQDEGSPSPQGAWSSGISKGHGEPRLKWCQAQPGQ
jgi:hypothetical protein